MSDRLWSDPQLASPHEVSDKAQRVRRMFDAIAPRYELVNSVFSAGRDRSWRRIAVRQAQVHFEDDVLDVACGTGNLARTIERAGPRSVTGCDFASKMLVRATGCRTSRCRWCAGDALNLPFRSSAFTVVACAFGVRNFADLDRGLGEMYRVLRSGGRLIILEFTRPANRVARRLYEWYAHRVMPRGAAWLSGDRSGAYRYLPCSVVSFLSAEQLCARLKATGFEQVHVKPLTMGIVTILVAHRGL